MLVLTVTKHANQRTLLALGSVKCRIVLPLLPQPDSSLVILGSSCFLASAWVSPVHISMTGKPLKAVFHTSFNSSFFFLIEHQCSFVGDFGGGQHPSLYFRQYGLLQKPSLQATLDPLPGLKPLNDKRSFSLFSFLHHTPSLLYTRIKNIILKSFSELHKNLMISSSKCKQKNRIVFFTKKE